MINLMLNDLCHLAGEVFRARLHFQGLILRLDSLIALALTGAAETTPFVVYAVSV